MKGWDSLLHQFARRSKTLPGFFSVGVLFVMVTLARFDAGPSRLATPQPAVHTLSPAYTLRQDVHSVALAADLPYLVHLPPGYDSNSDQRYTVLYMLHGLGGDYQEWQHDGLFATADALVASGAMEPIIIVTPEGGREYWVDHANGVPRWDTYVARDLVAHIDATYRTLVDPSHRAIGGMSMGAAGALQLALNWPGVFGVVGAHSLALRSYEAALPYFGDRAYYNTHEPVHLYDAHPALAQHLIISIDVGSNDGWSVAATAFHQELIHDAVPHVWHLNAGAHDDGYWASHVRDYLLFYGGALAGASEASLQAGLAQ